MKRNIWNNFVKARDKYRTTLEKLNRELPFLKTVQQELVDKKTGPKYQVETSIVYNCAIDEINPGTDVRLILVADNPGRREQAVRRYLVGPSGKLAEGFFSKHPSLGIDFRNNVLILNKTPVHTPRTADLRELCRLGGESLTKALAASQDFMAKILGEFHQIFAPLPVWIVGYGEMKRGGIFETYTRSLKTIYGQKTTGQNEPCDARREELLFFRHFSMNQFTVDFKRQTRTGETENESLFRMGTAYRERVLGTDL